MNSRYFSWTGLALAILGFAMLLSLLFALGGFLDASAAGFLVSVLGDVLFKSFHIAGFYLPIFLMATGYLMFAQRLRTRSFALLSLGFVPAMFTGLAFRFMFAEDFAGSPLPGFIAEHLGRSGGVVLCAVFGLVSFIAILAVMSFSEKSDEFPNESDLYRGRPSRFDEEGSVPDNFREAMAGRLKPIARNPAQYTDIDAPLRRAERKRLWDEEPVASTVSTDVFPSATGAKSVHEGTDVAAQVVEKETEYLQVYFGKDGVISDYPPSHKRIWTTLAEEDDEDNIPSGIVAPVVRIESIAPLAPSKPAVIDPEARELEEVLDSDEEDATGSEVQAEAEIDLVSGDLHIETSNMVSETSTESHGRHHDTISSAVAKADHHFEPDFGDDVTDDDADYIEGADIQTRMSIDELDADNEEFAAAALSTPVGPVETVTVSTPIKDEPLARSTGDRPEPAIVTTMGDRPDFAAESPEAEDEIDTSLLPPLVVTSWNNKSEWHVPIEGILDEHQNGEYWKIDEQTTRSASVLKSTLEEFGIAAEVTGIRKGPVITMFEILPAPGVKLARITNLADNIALRLAAQSVRIVAPIPGKHAVGIEIPNKNRATVGFAELIRSENFSSPKVEIPVALGKDIPGDAQIVDLTKTPHLLIAGATGSGKSVCVNALICSILYRRSPAEVNLILIDPKIVELKFYNDIPHLLTPVITDPRKAFQALQWCIYEMERRYSLLDAMQVRDIKSYNKKIKAKNIATPRIPYLVVVIDEFADLMATSGKELEGTLARLAAMSRAVGIHLVLATQRPSTDVITGLIKANIPSRIAFMVASKIDSRIIIDSMGAEKLLGKGDMLFTSAWDPFPTRMQGAFLSEDEVERIVAHVKTLGAPDYIDDEIFFDDEAEGDAEGAADFEGGEDPLMKEAIDIVVSAKKASASYLQRRLKVGYNRAARMVESMEEMGIVGPAQGSKPREILRMYA